MKSFDLGPIHGKNYLDAEKVVFSCVSFFNSNFIKVMPSEIVDNASTSKLVSLTSLAVASS